MESEAAGCGTFTVLVGSQDALWASAVVLFESCVEALVSELVAISAEAYSLKLPSSVSERKVICLTQVFQDQVRSVLVAG